MHFQTTLTLQERLFYVFLHDGSNVNSKTTLTLQECLFYVFLHD